MPTFNNYAGVYQLEIRDAGDLAEIDELDDAHWVATSVPVEVLSADSTFLNFVDTDENGRIRADELIQARDWLFNHLANRDRITERTDELRLEDIDTSHDFGQQIDRAARHVLENLDADEADVIKLSHVRDLQSVLSQGDANGDGVIPPSVVDQDQARNLIEDLMTCYESTDDASGEPGITAEDLNRFVEEASAILDWLGAGETFDQSLQDIWGEDAEQAYELTKTVREKIGEYFQLCDLVEYHPVMGENLDQAFADVAVDFRDQEQFAEDLADLPLAQPSAEGVLDLDGAVNPHYRNVLERVRTQLLEPLDGVDPDRMTRPEWRAVRDRFAEYEQWLQTKPETPLQQVDEATLRGYLEGEAVEVLREYVERDRAVEEQIAQIRNVEKLILYQKWLLELANNFVSVPFLYNPDRRSLFEIGTLVLGGRRFDFNVRVANRKEHKKMARNSGMYVLYVEVERPTRETFEIATAVTAGTIRELKPGKRGVFVTTDGEYWEARVISVIENPVSFRQALTSPFRRLSGFISDKIEAVSESGYEQLESTVDEGLKEPEPVKPANPTWLRDAMTGGGIAVAALGSSLAYIVSTLKEIQLIEVGFLLGIILFILMVPIAINAWINLRNRDFAPILEASGWAINVRMKLTWTLAHLFTRVPEYPAEARFRKHDQSRSRFVPSWWSTRVIVYGGLVCLIALLTLWGLIDWPAWLLPEWLNIFAIRFPIF